MLHSGVNWKAGRPSAHLRGVVLDAWVASCTSTMLLCLVWTLPRRANAAPASAMCLPPVMATKGAREQVRAGLAVLPHTDESQASMAVEVRYPVWLVWVPRLGHQTSPISARYC